MKEMEHHAQVGDYVVPDDWKGGIGENLLAGHEPIGDYPGSAFTLPGHVMTNPYPVNITITGRTLQFGKFSKPAMRCKIEWVHDGEPNVYSYGWIILRSTY